MKPTFRMPKEIEEQANGLLDVLNPPASARPEAWKRLKKLLGDFAEEVMAQTIEAAETKQKQDRIRRHGR